MKKALDFCRARYLSVHLSTQHVGASQCPTVGWHWLCPLGSWRHNPVREADTQVLGFDGILEEGNTHSAKCLRGSGRGASWRRRPLSWCVWENGRQDGVCGPAWVVQTGRSPV